jgi:hypothetical protein
VQPVIILIKDKDIVYASFSFKEKKGGQMKIKIIIMGLILIFVALPASASSHKTAEKPGYSGHYGDMDTSGDDGVDWKEFKAYFPHAETEIFKEVDDNKDEKIDHDEWHEFKEKHDYGHQEGNKHEKRQ